MHITAEDFAIFLFGCGVVYNGIRAAIDRDHLAEVTKAVHDEQEYTDNKFYLLTEQISEGTKPIRTLKPNLDKVNTLLSCLEGDGVKHEDLCSRVTGLELHVGNVAALLDGYSKDGCHHEVEIQHLREDLAVKFNGANYEVSMLKAGLADWQERVANDQRIKMSGLQAEYSELKHDLGEHLAACEKAVKIDGYNVTVATGIFRELIGRIEKIEQRLMPKRSINGQFSKKTA